MSDDARHWMLANVNGAIGGAPMNDTVISFVDLLYRRRLAVLQVASLSLSLSHRRRRRRRR